MWIETSAEVHAVIWARHKKELVVFSSFSDPTGDGYEWSSGRPEMMTEWGFRNSDNPLVKSLGTKDSNSDNDWNYKYYIYGGSE